MALVPVFCDNCRTLFATPNVIGGDVRASFRDVGFRPCPACGGTGRIPDGTYEFVGDTIRILSAPEWSPARLEGLAERLAAASSHAVDADAAIREISGEAPDLAPVINLYVEQAKDPTKWIALLLAIVGVLISSQGATTTDVEHMTNRIFQAIRDHPQAAPAERGGSIIGRPPVKRAKTRRARPGKSYGQAKKRRSRRRR